jgi:hypothetical protein
LAAVAILVVSSSRSTLAQDAPSQPKHTIKQVMKAHKGDNNLLSKVKSGDATLPEKLELLDLYISLYESDPPKGDSSSWKRKAGSALMAAAKVAAGREGAEGELQQATNCAACHKAHKP